MSDLTTFSTGPAPSDQRRWVAYVLFALVVVAMPAVTTVLAVERSSQLSSLDEYAHIDYLRRVEAGEIPRVGDKILPETRRDIACRTIEGRRVSDCSLPEIPADVIDAQAYSYQAQQPPLYYVVTALLRQPISLVVNGFVNSARLTGLVWLSSGLAVLWWFVRRRMHATAAVAAIACAIVGLAPNVVGQAATVNNDAGSVLSGALLLVGYERLRRDLRPRTVATAAAVAVLLVLVKPLVILGVGAITLALLLDRRDGRRTMAIASVPALAVVAAYQGWQVVRDLRAVVPYAEVSQVLLSAKQTLTEYPFQALGTVLPRFLTAYYDWDAAPFAPTYVVGVATVVGLVFVLTPSLSTVLGDGRRDLRHLHLGILLVLLAAPLLLITQAYLTVHKGGGANGRYALTLLPLTITALVPVLGREGPRRAAALLVAILAAATIGSLLVFEVPT